MKNDGHAGRQAWSSAPRLPSFFGSIQLDLVACPLLLAFLLELGLGLRSAGSKGRFRGPGSADTAVCGSASLMFEWSIMFAGLPLCDGASPHSVHAVDRNVETFQLCSGMVSRSTHRIVHSGTILSRLCSYRSIVDDCGASYDGFWTCQPLERVVWSHTAMLIFDQRPFETPIWQW